MTSELDGGLPMWVVYRYPRDFPRHIAVRVQWVYPGWLTAIAAYACLYDTLEEAMAECEAAGLVFLHPEVEDDPVIVGTWL